MKSRLLVLLCAATTAAVHAGEWDAPTEAPAASLDLRTQAGAAAVGATWRYAPARVVDTDFVAPGPDGQAGTRPLRTQTIMPSAGRRHYDDASWTPIAPEALAERRGGGLLSFNWYRVRLTIPERIGAFDTRHATAVFSVSIDDYAEVWVDGELARGMGQVGGSVIAGWNASNRLVVGRNLVAGREIELAVFGANGPLSSPPTNYVWIHEATLDFYPGDGAPVALPPREVNVEVIRVDPELDRVVSRNPKLMKLAEGFIFTEGPIWSDADGGYLLFSDPNANTIYRYSSAGTLAVFRHPSGYAGADVAEYGQPGSNGLTLDARGRLTANEHGNHRITRTEPDGRLTVLAAEFEGKRLNSPNDLVYRSDGALYFTDPPFGLPRFGEDPRKALDFNGVFLLKDRRLSVLSRALSGPNGIALSPDERHLYVGNWDDKRKIVMRFSVRPDGTTSAGEVFFDMTDAPGADAIDGIKVDVEGRLYVSGPGGLWVIAPDGRHLGTIVPPVQPHNFAFGDADGRTLYITAERSLYKMRLGVEGIRPRMRDAH